MRASWGTEAKQEPSAPTVEAPSAPSVCCSTPKIANCTAPTTNAKADVVTQPETRVPTPSSLSVLAPVRVCASVRIASAGYVMSCAPKRLTPPAASLCGTLSVGLLRFSAAPELQRVASSSSRRPMRMAEARAMSSPEVRSTLTLYCT